MIKNIILGFFAIISVILFVLLKNTSTSSPVDRTDGLSTNGSVVNQDTNASLNLSNKDLDKLPSNVLTMTKLESLDISNNNITGALPAEIRHLQNLKTLKANNNQMTGVPAEVGQLSNLEVLDLSNNQLTGLPNEIGNLKKLKILNLSGNDYSKQDLETIKQGLPLDVQIIL